MYYEDQVIEEVRSRNDVVTVIGSYVKLKRAGANYTGLCPFHNEKTPSFIVSPNRQTYKCFGCGKGGNVITFIMEYENYSFQEALKHLADLGGVTLPEQEMTNEQKTRAYHRKRMQDVYKFAATYFYRMLRTPKGQFALDYLKNRQLSEETITKFGLGYSDGTLYNALKAEGYEDAFLGKCGLFTFTEREGVTDKFWNRVMYPIMDANSKVIAFGGRVMGDGMPKYLNSPETEIFEKGRNLYGLHVARRTKQQYYLLCEGYMDTISLHQAGYDNAVASLGTALTSDQARLLSRYTKVVRITYDNDGAGQSAANRAIPILREAGIRSYVVNMSPYKDPDEFIKALGAEEYQKRIDQAIPGFNFEIAYLAKDYNLNEPEQKIDFERLIARKMLGYPDELERNNYLEAFCREYYVSVPEFKKLVNRMGSNVAVTERMEEQKNRDRKDIEMRKSPEKTLLSEEVVLSLLAEEPKYFSAIEGILTPEDFSEGIYRNMAAGCFRQYKEEGKITSARLINAYDTAEEQSLAAKLFDTNYPLPTEANDRKKAFVEAVYKIKENRLKTDTELSKLGFKELAERKKDLAGLKAQLNKKMG